MENSGRVQHGFRSHIPYVNNRNASEVVTVKKTVLRNSCLVN